MKKICILGSGVGGGILALELLKKCDAQIYIVVIDAKNEQDSASRVWRSWEPTIQLL